MQSESSPGVANDRPQQDEARSYPADQTAEYPNQNILDRGTLTPSPLTPGSPEKRSRTLHPSRGIAKTIQQCREKYYVPGLAAKIANHNSLCMECAQTKRTPNSTITPPLIDMSKIAMGPEHALQMDIKPFDDPSGGYNAVIRATEVFSRYLFAYSVVRIDTKTVTRVLTDIITRHCYLPTTKLTDKGSQIISEAMQQTIPQPWQSS